MREMSILVLFKESVLRTQNNYSQYIEHVNELVLESLCLRLQGIYA